MTGCGTPSDTQPDRNSTGQTQSSSAESAQVTQSRPNSKASLSGASFPFTVTDWYGHEVTFTQKPKRVVLTTGSAFNLWYEVGGEAVGTTNRSENIRLLPEVAAAMDPLPILGPSYSIDQEKLLSLNPDLVVCMGPPQDRLADNLRKMGINAINMTLRTKDDVLMAYEIFGAINGNHAKAVEKAKRVNADTQAVIDKFPKDKAIKIAIVHVTAQALTVKLDSSIAGDMAKSLGLQNVATGRTPNAPGSEHSPMDIEFLAKNQPDIILVTSMMANNDEARAKLESNFNNNSAWQAIDAVREGRIRYLPQQYFLFNAGPYYPDALEYLAASVRPDVYGEPKKL